MKKNLLMISGDRSVAAGKQGAFSQTLRELSAHWERIDVICPFAGSAPHQFEDLPVYIHPSPRGLWYQPWWILAKGRELYARHRHHIMTVHCYPPFYNSVGAGWLARKTGLQYVLEVHHIVGYPHPASLAERIGRALSRRFLPLLVQSAAGVRTVNAAVRSVLIAWGIAPDAIRIISSMYLDTALLRSIPVQQKRYDIAFCGRLVANKGLMELLQAVATLPSVWLVVIGDGPLRSSAQKRARALGIADRVDFAGWLPAPEDVLKTLLQAQVFVMNSRSEGGPRVLLEAMALGMPCIATPVGMAPEVIKDGYNGILTTGAPDDLARQIARLLADASLRERIGSAARAVLDVYDRTETVGAYARYLQSV